ncbi:unnamed protein product [Ectocarpus sp. 13 AM-2016]
MPCKKKTTKKYSTRPSPPYPAAQCCIGSKKRGNSGSMYVVKSNVNGIKRWVKATKKTPVTRKKTEKSVSINTGKIRRKSLVDDVSGAFKPYYAKPRGKFIFFDENTNDFRSPERWGTALIYGESAKLFVKDGWKVWVVEGIPPSYGRR